MAYPTVHSLSRSCVKAWGDPMYGSVMFSGRKVSAATFPGDQVPGG